MVIANDLEGELVPQWDDLQMPAQDIFVPGFPNLPDFDAVEIGILFDKASTETLGFTRQMHHSYKEGSNVIPHIHWEPKDTDTGDVLWQLQYKWKNNNESDPGWTTITKLATANGEALRQQIDNFAEIDGTGKKISSMFTFKLSRLGGDISDDYDNDALLKEFDLHFQMDTRGSVQASSKL